MDTNKPLTVIAFGRSGCGKGTQLKLLSQKIKDQKNIVPEMFSTGDFFRELFSQNSYTSKIAESLTNAGKLQPLFLTVAMWGNAFVKNLEEGSDMFIDGFPRRLDEAKILAEALEFYGRKNIIIMDFLVSRETSKERMLKRGRSDDTQQNAEVRLDWYDTDVTEGLEYLKQNSNYVYIPFDGEKTIEQIHADVMNKLENYI